MTLEELKKKVLQEFDERWQKVQCLSHDKLSSDKCICDELADINEDYGYDEIKVFLQAKLDETFNAGVTYGANQILNRIP